MKIKNFYYLVLLLITSVSYFGCEKENEKPFSDGYEYSGGTISDIDGNTYDTIVIGTQTWMAQNLMVTKYIDGSDIPRVTDNTKWAEDTLEGAYCDYNNDPGISESYGRLYNWNAVKTDSICPEGWHVPTRSDWTKLNNFINQDSLYIDSAAVALKSTFGWDDNANGDDYYHLRVLPAGCRLSDGRFMDLGSFGHFWTPEVFYHPVTFNCPYWGYDCKNNRGHGISYSFNRYEWELKYYVQGYDVTRGYSVRCIKD
ncbi:MAG: hypothetical protein JW717_02655 [Marinilabiliaceae bacterium]|nr:hypothetical protein [Marinilabiliaceae bacterium]